MAHPEPDDRLTDDDRAPDEYDYELVEPVTVGADSRGETTDAEARLTLPGPNGERVTVAGDPADLRHRLDQILAWGSGETAAEQRARIEEYPMPDLDDLETVPADERYGEVDRGDR